MATSEEVADLRKEVEKLRQEVEGAVTAGLEGSRRELRDALGRIPNMEEFYDHLTAMDKKIREDQAGFQRQLDKLKEAHQKGIDQCGICC